jgi:DNA-binding CsgD family transcriptional regulator
MELLEREASLAELHHLLSDAGDRRGRILFLGGEAGVGKTSLVEAFCRQVADDVESIRSSCDALSTPGPLNSVRPHAQALGVTFEPQLREGLVRDELFHAMFEAIDRRDTTMLMVGEDAHWADEASLDLVRYIGRRIDSLPLLLIITYRDDEVGPYHPLQRILGDLATAPGYRRMSLLPLSEAAVRALAAGSDIDPSTLYQQTGGNPFYVTEVLAAGRDVVPTTVSDAALARASRLSPNARFVLGTAAVLGGTVDLDLLAGMAGSALDEIEECLASGLLRLDRDALMFRHQLGRDAIYNAIIPPRRRMLHGRALALLRELPNRDEHLAELAHHAELAGDRDATLEFAVAAAEQAREMRSHREAAQQYARALRLANSLASAERALLLEGWSYECYLTNQLADAIDGRRAAVEIWREHGNLLKESENLRWLSRVSWFAGRNAEAGDAARTALAVLEPVPPGPQLAWAYSNMSQLAMLAFDRDGAVFWGERAIALAEQLGDREILVHALTNVGSARMNAGDARGRDQLEHSLGMALEAGLEYHAARAWTAVSSSSVLLLQLTRARTYLADGIAYTTDRDLDSLRLYMTAWRAVLRLHEGDWPGAEVDCAAVLEQPRSVAVSKIVALATRGRLRARRGEADAMAALDESLALANPTHIGMVCAARAEAAWLAAEPMGDATGIRELLRDIADRLNPWERGEITWWLRQSGDATVPDGELAEPYALQIAGDWLAAAETWESLGCPYEAARARLMSADEATLRAALATFERLGAAAAVTKARQRLREIGATASHRGPNRTTRVHPAGLTAREAEILALICDGCTNREIAERLFLSPKTVEHHVTAVLAKLGVPSRRDAIRVAADLSPAVDLQNRKPA